MRRRQENTRAARILSLLDNRHHRVWTVKEIQLALDIPPDRRASLRASLANLKKRGRLYSPRRGEFRLWRWQLSHNREKRRRQRRESST